MPENGRSHPGRASPAPPRFIGDAAVALVSAFLCCVLLVALIEAALRFSAFGGMNFNVEMWKYERTMKRPAAVPGVVHEHIPGRRARLMGVDVAINGLGLRDREIPYEKHAGVTRILMLGDSITFGWGVAEDETMANRLQSLLHAARGRRHEVVNAGTGNYNTSMEVSWFLSEGLRYRPDFVVLNYFINDAEPDPVTEIGLLAANSYAYSFLYGKVDAVMRRFFGAADWKAYYKSLYRPGAAGLERMRASFERLVGECRARGIGLAVVNHPELRVLDPYPFADEEASIRRMAADRGIPYLDLLGAVASENPSKLWVTEQDSHPNGYAALLFARAIAAWLGPLLP